MAKKICQMLLWCFAFCSMIYVFYLQSEPLYMRKEINDALGETTSLCPQDILSQTFLLDTEGLESVSIAIDYDEALREQGSLKVSCFCDDELIMEQPLPFMACPPKVFLEFSLKLKERTSDDLTILIENTSANKNCVFSVLSTPDFYKYSNYSEGYRINESDAQDRSILCRFKYKSGHHYYKGLTGAFYVFLAAIILSHFLDKAFAWRQQHTVH